MGEPVLAHEVADSGLQDLLGVTGELTVRVGGGLDERHERGAPLPQARRVDPGEQLSGPLVLSFPGRCEVGVQGLGGVPVADVSVGHVAVGERVGQTGGMLCPEPRGEVLGDEEDPSEFVLAVRLLEPTVGDVKDDVVGQREDVVPVDDRTYGMADACHGNTSELSGPLQVGRPMRPGGLVGLGAQQGVQVAGEQVHDRTPPLIAAWT